MLNESLLDVEEIAKLAGTSAAYIRMQMQKGKLKSVRHDRLYAYRGDVTKWLDNRRARGRPRKYEYYASTRRQSETVGPVSMEEHHTCTRRCMGLHVRQSGRADSDVNPREVRHAMQTQEVSQSLQWEAPPKRPKRNAWAHWNAVFHGLDDPSAGTSAGWVRVSDGYASRYSAEATFRSAAVRHGRDPDDYEVQTCRIENSLALYVRKIDRQTEAGPSAE